MSESVVFEEPPSARGGKILGRDDGLRAIAATLRERPNEWARIGTYTSATSAGSTGYNIRSGRMSAFQPAGAFEAVSRTVDGEHRVYARYVGDTPAGGES